MRAFLHYPSEQLELAHTLFGFVRSLGIDIWFDKENLVGGDEWKSELDKAIQSVDFVIAILSKETTAKTGILQREIKQIIDKAQEMPIGGIFFVGMRAEPIALPAEIAKWQWIDLFEDNWRRLLLQTVEKKFRQTQDRMPDQMTAAIKNAYDISRSRLVIIDEKYDFADFDESYPVFDRLGRYWKFVNSRIEERVLSSYFNDFHWIKMGFQDRKLAWSFHVKEYFLKEDLLSFEINWYVDQGGAHPNHGTYTLNFFGTDLGEITLRDILGSNEINLRKVAKLCKDAIKFQIEALGEEIQDLDFFENAENLWETYDIFCFNEDGIKFHFPPYKILAYVYGDFQVSLPWKFILPQFAEEYKETKFHRFVNMHAG